MPLSQEQIVQQFMNCQTRLRAMAYSMCMDYHIVDDIMQEVAVTLIKKRASFDETKPFAPWAAGITRFKVLEYFRKNKKSPVPMDDELLIRIQDNMLTAMQEIDMEERANAVTHCISKLPDENAELLKMKYIKSYPVKKIADEINRSVVGTQSLLQRVRGKVLECVQKTLKEMNA